MKFTKFSSSLKVFSPLILPVTAVLQTDHVGVVVFAKLVRGKALRHHQARERAQEIRNSSPIAD